MTEDEIKKLEPFLSNESFDPKLMESKSMAAANLCNWVVNIVKFNRIYVKVKPLMDQLEAAGIVGPSKGSKVREVLFKTEYELDQFLKSME